ncbi:MAG: DNA repair protein RadC [Gammaproteobacteria bacterium]|nr:DNA repair protein RadC [Gammaproteobacteria bacterium]
MKAETIKLHATYSNLSDTELMEKLIGVRQTQKHYHGSLSEMFTTSQSNNSLPARCVVARELVRRWLNEELKRDCVLNAPEAVRDCLRIHFAGREHECFVAMFLDAQHRLIATHELFRGTLTQTSVYPREVVKAALRENAAAVIFSHNHPSGVAEPSQSDQQLTTTLKNALALVDVRVLDHFIVAGTSVLSFAERGFI